MKKRLIIIALLVGVAVVAAVVVKREFFPAPGVTVQNFKRLETWMTEDEFDAVLGAGGECWNVPQPVTPGEKPVVIYAKRWVSNGMRITICFHDTQGGDPSNYALSGHCKCPDGSRIELARFQGHFFDNIRYWVGW